MKNLTISIFENQFFLKTLKEIKLFSNFKINYYDNLDLLLKNSLDKREIVILFDNEKNYKNLQLLIKNNIPIIFITKSPELKKNIYGEFIEKISSPFLAVELKKKITSLFAKYQFNKNSFINLSGYTINKNERKIVKKDIELKLTEKEINFLILFSKNKNPLSRDFLLKNVWNYASETDTHTVETHIHRLRKKVLKKFNDNNFIKNDNRGYFI
tara:strand:+ start:610 stop:1248 length:639 start_codon:yes stop_codon:yes gene_type:complete